MSVSYSKKEVLRPDVDIRSKIDRELKAAKILRYRQQLVDLRAVQARCGWLSENEMRQMEEATRQLTALTGKKP